MKIHLEHILFIITLSTTLLKAQTNLVPNPSFEEKYSCPNYVVQFDRVKEWFSPSNATPDYFNSCCPPYNPPTEMLTPVGIPQNSFGYENAHSGNAYSGQYLYKKSTNNYTEYIAIKLNAPLVSNKDYCLDFYISTADSSMYSANKIGAAFFNNNPSFNTFQNLPISPQINLSNLGDVNGNGWHNMNASFNAMGGEEYLVIGSFWQYSDLQIDSINSGTDWAYYYIDDVSLSECPVGEIPNVFTPNNDGKNDVFKINNLPAKSDLKIYSRWGTIVYSSTNYQNNWDGGSLSDGVYYYVLKLPNGDEKHGTVTLLR